MKRRDIKKPKSKKEAAKRPLLLIKALPALFAAGLMLAVGIFFCRFILNSGYFVVENARLVWHDKFGIISPNRYIKLSSVGRGKNIFKLDIKAVDSKIESDYPELESCSVERRFPDELVINIYARQPAAQIDYSGRFYVVDRDAIILSEPRTSSLKGLPLIAGVGWRPSSRIGERYQSVRLSDALELLYSIEESGLLNDHSLRWIDISDHRNLAFFIDNNLEIKIGRNRFRERLDLLKEALSSSYVDKNDLEYIDLRFDDIVFGTR